MKWLVCLALLLLTGCSGLPRPREMGDMALLRIMGVDAAEEQLAVTVSTGPRAKGLQGETQPALVLTAREDSLSAAALSLQKQSEQYIFFGYVDQLLAGEALAESGLRPVLDYFARDRELGLGAQLWVARGAGAEQAVCSGGENGIEERLDTLRTDGALGIAARARTVGEVYADLLERGSAWLPALTVEEDSVAQMGYAILKEDVLVGYLDGEEAKGLELLTGRTGQDILELETGEQRVSVWVSGASVRYRLAEDGVDVYCRVEAQVVEYGHVPAEQEQESIRRLVHARELARIEAAAEQLQRWGADCVGIGPKAGVLRPGLWQERKEHWSERFGQQAIRIQVDVHLPEPRIG